eukprot:6557784-Prymnesium_polylepis.1
MGNDGAAAAWGAGPVTTADAPNGDREAAIVAKYAKRRHVSGEALRAATAPEAAEALVAAVRLADAPALLSHLVAGAPLATLRGAALLAAASAGEAGAPLAALLLAW